MATSSELDFDNEVRMLLIGKTGTGKSTTGNTILGGPKFKSMLCGKAVTSVTEYQWAHRFGKKIVVVDTPGVCDPSMTEAKLIKEISKWYTLMSPGIHAILLVVKAGRFTEEDRHVVELFMTVFGNDLKDHLIVVFTDKDQLKSNRMTVDSYIKTMKSSSNLYKLIMDSQKRCVAVGIRDDNEEEVRKILSMVDAIRGKDGKKYFSNSSFKQVEEEIEKIERNQLRERRTDTSEDEMRNKTRRSIADEKSSGKALLDRVLPILKEISKKAFVVLLTVALAAI